MKATTTITLDPMVLSQATAKYPRTLSPRIEEFLRADLQLPSIEQDKTTDPKKKLANVEERISILQTTLQTEKQQKEKIEKEVQDYESRTIRL